MCKVALILCGILITVASAQDVRDKVTSAATEATLSNLIDPDASIYGIVCRTSEDEFISRFGKPTGYVRITPHESGMIYGRGHCFFFTDGKLSGVRITLSVWDWAIGNRISDFTPFDSVKWTLSNQISRDSNLTDVKRIVGEKLIKDGSQYYFSTDRARVDLEISHLVTAGDRDEAWRIRGLVVRKR